MDRKAVRELKRLVIFDLPADAEIVATQREPGRLRVKVRSGLYVPVPEGWEVHSVDLTACNPGEE